jgi:ABC-type multidrug transport system ATPase subunit
MRVSKIAFKVGSSIATGALSVSPGRVVAFVGPNNSGKSLALRELESIIRGSRGDFKVLDEVRIEYPSDFEDFRALIDALDPIPMEGSEEGYIVLDPASSNEPGGGSTRVSLSNIIDWHNSVMAGNEDGPARMNYVKLFVIRLDAETRFALVHGKRRGSMRKAPKNYLTKLLKNDALRTRVREVCERAFSGLFFVLDPTGAENINIMMSVNQPEQDVERSLTDTAIEFFDNAIPIRDFGDGVKALIGIVSAVAAMGQKFILIDDPEAFLHPPVARLLGRELVGLTEERDAQLFLTTHSADFLQGCLEVSSLTNVVRLTYDRTTDTATARGLDPQILSALMKNRLLRTAGVLSALFNRGAVVTESEEDKVVYDEVNRRLLSVGRGSKDTVFLNAQNWQTTCDLAGPLRQLGIPVAIVLDIDVLLTAKKWTDIFRACNVPSSHHADLAKVRSKIKTDGVSRSAFKKDGLDALSAAKSITSQIIDNLASYGIFVVPVGELESWLRHLQIIGKGAKWAKRFFEAVGSTDDAPNFIQPRNDDIWSFVDIIGKWIDSPNRLGIPV